MSDVAYLILENGKIFKGKSFGYDNEMIAEIVFTTGMTGYLETLTDKNHFGQIVVQTFPLIGNYGVIRSDLESDNFTVGAYIVKHWCQEPSNFRNEGALDAFLKAKKIIGLYDIDTRALTKIIRENGVMNGKISKTSENVDIDEIKRYSIKNAVASVSTQTPYFLKSDSSKYRVALLDLGLKNSIVKELLKRGCDVTVLPAHTDVNEILSLEPDGVMLSNGPGDPSESVSIIRNIKELLQSKIPLFGICLGHEILALANGFTTTKLKYGHRGANQPVKDLSTNRVYITSQNHGYAVVSGSIDGRKARELFINVNDLTCEGIEYKDYPAFSVQFYPGSGPKDTAFLYDRFVGLMYERYISVKPRSISYIREEADGNAAR